MCLFMSINRIYIDVRVYAFSFSVGCVYRSIQGGGAAVGESLCMSCLPWACSARELPTLYKVLALFPARIKPRARPQIGASVIVSICNEWPGPSGRWLNRRPSGGVMCREHGYCRAPLVPVLSPRGPGSGLA